MHKTEPSPSSKLARPRLLVLDTSHLAAISKDYVSSDITRRRVSNYFLDWLSQSEFTLLFSFHQIEELLKHKNDETVTQRINFITSIPFVCWIKPHSGADEIGSNLDLLCAEVSAAANHTGCSAIDVRDVVVQSFFKCGSGSQMMALIVNNWRIFREYFLRSEQAHREIVAIRQSDFAKNEDTKVLDWLIGAAKEPDESDRILQQLQKRLEQDIANNGDKRISSPSRVAGKFIQNVRNQGLLASSNSKYPGINFLHALNIYQSDISPDMTMSELGDLANFRRKLSTACIVTKIKWDHLVKNVHIDQIPTCIVQRDLFRHAQKLPEHKGSDLIDEYLGCLAIYADVTYVDKRTKENFRRAKQKSMLSAKLLGQIERAGHYNEIINQIG